MLKNKVYIIFLFLALLTPCFSSISIAERLPGELKFTPLVFTPPKTTRVTLENGMILHLHEDHELPLINISSIIKGGSMYDPKNKTGLASLAGTLMKTGGTKKRTAEMIDEELEFIAGSAIVHFGESNGIANLSVLKKDIDLGLEIFADILMNPIYNDKKIELEKNEMIEDIRRENDDPETIASRELYKKVYADTPKGRYPTIETVSGITREDLLDFHNKFIAPNNMMIGITGDFDQKEIIEKLNKVFSGWNTKTLVFHEPAPIEDTFNGSVNYVYKDNTQTVIRLGHLGIKKTNPDYYAVKILSNILGEGGFTSRLMKNVRSDRGLAYSIWSHFIPDFRESGIFMAGCATKSESTVEALSIILKTIREIMETPVSDDELKTEKESIINSFVFGFTTPEQIVQNRMIIEFNGLPEDYLETFREKIDKVTKEDVLRVAKKYLHPDGLKMVIVGDQTKFDRPLSELGEVTTIQLEKH